MRLRRTDTSAAGIAAVLMLMLAPIARPGVHAQTGQTETFTVMTGDGVEVHGDLNVPGSARAVIVLFHQGGSNVRAEYAPVIPRLLSEGYGVVAADLRRGGQLFGSWNRTVAAYPDAGSYCEAEADVDAVVSRVRTDHPDRPIVLWGSSYSAALVLRAAARNPDAIRAVLAFSPASGEPMDGCRPEETFGELRMPALILRPPNEAAIESVQAQLDAARSHGLDVFIAEAGAHGSSMLIDERVGADASANRDRVLSFIEVSVAD